ncbi:DNA-3-methyladenine glycosylase [Actinacidiphila soli]|uniref:DNA-3-methyladenine glycosylase n=1 Tax=Actinacidiphila soli TaxID=2487275 RepID=UPI000FCABE11
MAELGQLMGREFFARPAHEVAPELLGHVLLRRTGEGDIALRMTEVEAYAGSDDPASHGWKGRTLRNAVMFEKPGHLYVYWVYGMHWAINLVCAIEGEAAGVLIRAGEIVQGEDLARRHRPTAKSHSELAKGPGRLGRALHVDRSLNGADVCAPISLVQMREGAVSGGKSITCGPRTGVSRGSETPWRFWIEGDPTVSPYRRHTPRRGGTS